MVWIRRAEAGRTSTFSGLEYTSFDGIINKLHALKPASSNSVCKKESHTLALVIQSGSMIEGVLILHSHVS